jgi:hypothetical protein
MRDRTRTNRPRVARLIAGVGLWAVLLPGCTQVQPARIEAGGALLPEFDGMSDVVKGYYSIAPVTDPPPADLEPGAACAAPPPGGGLCPGGMTFPSHVPINAGEEVRFYNLDYQLIGVLRRYSKETPVPGGVLWPGAITWSTFEEPLRIQQGYLETRSGTEFYLDGHS